MATLLVCSTPAYGHVAPMLRIAEYLVTRGHRVIMLTGSAFEKRVVAGGVEFRSLTGIADVDTAAVFAKTPDRSRRRQLARLQGDMQELFVRTIPDQLKAVTEVIENDEPDAILVDSTFTGIMPLILGGKRRPPIIGAGVIPLTQTSRDVAPFGLGLAPGPGPFRRLRNRVLTLAMQRVVFRKTQQAAERMALRLGATTPAPFVLDVSTTFDKFLQLAPKEFEYPRRDLPENTWFAGPVPVPSPTVTVPPWWDDLDDGRPIVHVTQGTIDNADLSKLVLPTIEALGNTDVLVVVSTGGAHLGELPDNVRVAEFLPYDLLMPKTAVFVTNGGYGGVQQALRYGVPIVVAGDTEDKPEVAARVAWAGVGVNLRTGSPSPSAISSAVQKVLADPTFRGKAGHMKRAISQYTPLETIERELHNAAGRGAPRAAMS
ncbi:glycosyltransferase [Marisediminicola senii]|uniref:glycosyltransferase n=1 Tax=Marisediminicola senii TaxID=2711233 RepID=UPI0013EA3DB0|nr:nucleotide disphospho-sugar-binding domain-containing protein [Marisediminicola senii]